MRYDTGHDVSHSETYWGLFRCDPAPYGLQVAEGPLDGCRMSLITCIADLYATKSHSEIASSSSLRLIL